jgi:hypothetical protein
VTETDHDLRKADILEPELRIVIKLLFQRTSSEKQTKETTKETGTGSNKN